MRNSVLVILLDLSRGRRHEVGRRYDHFVCKAPMFFMQFANCMADCR